LAEPSDDVGERIHNVINAIREERCAFMKINIIREGEPLEGRFFWKLVEDRASFGGGTYSYGEYLGQINRLSQGAKS